MRWLGDDRADELVVCWQRGRLFVNAGAEGPPCLGLREAAAEAPRQVGILHMDDIKRSVLQNLTWRPEALEALTRATELTLTREGVWLPVDGAEGAAAPQRHELLSGMTQAVLTVTTEALRRHVLALSQADAARRCHPSRNQQWRCAAPTEAPRIECIEACESGGEARSRDACARALRRLRTRMCKERRLRTRKRLSRLHDRIR